MNALFTYGSLMFNPVMSRIVTADLHGMSATGLGIKRGAVRGEHYPGVQRVAGSKTQGVLYFDVSAQDITRLDAFEGEHYTRDSVLVELPSGQRIPAWTYVYRFADRLTPEDWSPERFEREGMQPFLAHYTPTRL